MLIVAEFLLIALCVLLWAPGTPIGKALRTTLIEDPAEVLRRLTPWRLVVGLMVFLFLLAFAIGAPEWIAMFGFVDMATYLDIAVILILISANTRVRLYFIQATRLVHRITSHIVSRRTMARRRRTRLHNYRSKTPSSDGDGEARSGQVAVASQNSHRIALPWLPLRHQPSRIELRKAYMSALDHA